MLRLRAFLLGFLVIFSLAPGALAQPDLADWPRRHDNHVDRGADMIILLPEISRGELAGTAKRGSAPSLPFPGPTRTGPLTDRPDQGETNGIL